MSNAAQRILILDEIDVKPGMAARVREAYRSQYMPGAQTRGMTLESAWQHPPAIDVEQLPSTLYFVWSVEGEAGWWKQRLSRKADGSDEREEKHAFWLSIGPMILDRKRRMLTDQREDG